MKLPFIKLNIFFLLIVTNSLASTNWPKVINANNGSKITIYQPTPEKFQNNILNARAAISVQAKGSSDLVFGAVWCTAKMNTDRETRMVELESIKIDNVKFPDITDTVQINKLKTLLETEIPKWKLQVSLDALIATIEQENPQKSDDISNTPPKIVYTDKLTTLVLIDGEPKLEMDENMKMKKVLNTPFLILEDGSTYYLYGGKYWYKSSAIKEGWTTTDKLPQSIAAIDKQIKEKSKEAAEASKSADAPKTPPAIFVTTEPMELIQTDGQANMKNIDSTNLLYIANTSDNIFMDITSQMYFTLLSGRWYQSKSLQGPWSYIAAEKLPADFAKIPEGSEKDVVLASVPGTAAAKEAVMDAQIPQTAKVDRKTATCTVKYDGEPKFEAIEGTGLAVAKNTSSTVLKSGNKYYCVENGIWFVATAPTGPWTVSDDRPKDVESIPASSEVYNVKYVYIYETTPQYVYVGYTPGYMGCYVYGPTVVYGTGYYYSPWYGPYYYPHPVTYGFSFSYNPYYGWSMGVGFSYGCFSYHAVYRPPYGYYGPHGYHPPYHPPYHGGGYYGHRVNHYGNTTINVDRSNNIYAGNKGVSTRDINRNQPSVGSRPSQQPAGNSRPSQQPSTRPSTQPAISQQPSTRPAQQPANKADNVRTDRDGNVFRQNTDGSIQQRNNNQWQNSDRSSQMNQHYQNNNRAQTRDQNFNNMGGASRNSQGAATRPAGGNSRPSGGGARGGGGRR